MSQTERQLRGRPKALKTNPKPSLNQGKAMQVHVEMDRQEYRQKADEAHDQGEPGNGHRSDLRCDNPRDHRSDERAPSGARVGQPARSE